MLHVHLVRLLLTESNHVTEGPNSLTTLRYWLVLSLMFLSEMLLEQITLSPTCSVFKLVFLIWCVLPIQSNGTSIIFEQVNW